MDNFTEKQRNFIVNKVAGVKNREAAIAAGYAPNAADVTAAKLLQKPSIKAAIKAAKAAEPMPPVATPQSIMPRTQYADPMLFLEDVMNHAQMPLAVRLDAAKSLLPYKHPRMGELGKKASAKDRAEALTTSSRFATKKPPTLHVVE